MTVRTLDTANTVRMTRILRIRPSFAPARFDRPAAVHYNALFGMPEIILYTRAGCHLCDEAKAQLEVLRQAIHFDLRLVDVDSDPALKAQFTNDVPVVFLNGKKVAKHRLDLARLRRQLERAVVGRGFNRDTKHSEKTRGFSERSPAKRDERRSRSAGSP